MSIAPYQQTNGAAVAVPEQPAAQVSAVAALVEWAHGAQAAYEVAENLVNTSFCPKHYQGKPHEATAAILAGLEVGLQPMAALQSFHSIQGVAAPKAVTLRAIVQSHGHDIWVEESSATRCVVAGRRKGSAQVQRSEWTIERATTMGLPAKNPNWKTQAPAMLVARASSECARMIGSDAILGIPYSVEELEDGGSPVRAVAEQVQPPPVRRRNVASVLPAAAEPVVEPSGSPNTLAGVPDPESTRIDPKGQVRQQITDLFVAKGVAEDERAHVVSEVIGRRVGSPKELTHVEAARVIARLEQMPAPEQGGGS